jgi:outer membrane protein assembly factor BamB
MKLAVLLVVCFFALFTFAQAQALPGSVAYQVNQAHTGAINITGLERPLQVKWSVTLNGTASYPLILLGEVIVIDGGNETAPSTLEALSATDGSILWSQPVQSGYGGWVGAAYDNGMVFAVNYDTPGFSSGSMSAFSATTGALLWTSALPGQYQFTSAPTAMNGIVFTGGAGEGGTVYALSESDGKLLWTQGVENGDTSAPAIVGDGVYVSYVCPQAYRFNGKTGDRVWYYAGGCEGGGGDTAVVYDGLVYVRDIYNYATSGITLNAATGALVGGFNSQYAPAFSGSSAFYTEASSLTAVDLTTGNTIWSVAPSSGASFSCSPIVVNSIVFMGTSTGTLLGYDAHTGKQGISMNLGQAISCSEYFVVPQAGMGAGQGMIVVPAGTAVYALQ